MAKNRKKIPAAKKPLTFEAAVKLTPEVTNCYQKGLQAVPKVDKSKVQLTDTTKCGGSLFIDQCLIDQGLYPQGNRWDYAVDYNGEVYFFETHTASTSEVRTVLAKLQWLKDWLVASAPEINKLKAKSKTPYYWVQSDGYHILKNSAHERAAIQSGIKPISKLIL